jgi:hypothetical protein
MRNIYKGTVISAFLVLISTTAYSQGVELGARGMATFSSLNLKTSTGGSVKGETTLGYGFGGLLGVSLAKHVGVQLEVNYNSLLQKYKNPGIEQKINLRYLSIPILISFFTNKEKPVNVNVVAGPQVGIIQGSSIRTTGNNDGTTTTQAVLSVKKSDIGLAYGAGIDFGLNESKHLRLGFGFRGVLGLLDISDNSETIVSDSYYVLDRTHIKTYSVYAGISVLL